MEMTGTTTPVGGDGGDTTAHDQLPSLEEARMAAEKEHSANDNLKRRLHYSYIGLAVVGGALLLTIILAIALSPKGASKSTDSITLSSSGMKAAIQEEAYAILSFDKPNDYSFLPGKPQSRALAKVQEQAHRLTYSQTVEQYAMWCLYYHTINPQDSTSWSNNKPVKGPSASSNHDWCLFGGIRCNRKGRIVELVLTNLKLSGYVPEEILLLKDLRTIKLGSNADLGKTEGTTFPTWLMLKPNDSIKVIDLRGTGYSGSVSDSVCNEKPFNMQVFVDCPYKVTCNCCDGCD